MDTTRRNRPRSRVSPSHLWSSSTRVDNNNNNHKVKNEVSSSTTTIRTNQPSSSILHKTRLEHAKQIVTTFHVEQDFDPLIQNEHLQTILGYVLRDYAFGRYVPKGPQKPANRNYNLLDTLLKINQSIFYRNNYKNLGTGTLSKPTIARDERGTALQFWDQRQRIETPDGDWFHADTKFTVKPFVNHNNDNDDEPPPLVVLLHGLQSCSGSALSIDLARAFTEKAGMDCTCLNFRSCSGEPNNRLGAYHLGFDQDLRHYLSNFVQTSPGKKPRRVYLAGFSLGANVILKCLGQLGDQALDLGIVGAAALCAPLDQRKNSPTLHQSGVRSIYVRNLLESLKESALEQKGRDGCELLDYDRIMNADSIIEFDDAFIAPIYGFDSCWDYYDKTSSIHVLSDISVPTLILNAQDDPFMDPDVWPIEKSCEFGGPAPLKMVRTRHGGHLGFCFHQVDEDDERLRPTKGNGNVQSSLQPTWCSWEAARFLKHVEDAINQS